MKLYTVHIITTKSYFTVLKKWNHKLSLDESSHSNTPYSSEAVQGWTEDIITSLNHSTDPAQTSKQNLFVVVDPNPIICTSHLVPYSVREVFNHVLNVGKYPKFCLRLSFADMI